MKVLEKEFPPNTKYQEKVEKKKKFVIILFRVYTTMKEEKEAKGECRTTRHVDVVVVEFHHHLLDLKGLAVCLYRWL